MMEHTTDRLFWTLTSVIVGALLLTIGIKAFPQMAQNVLQPVSGIMKQADTANGHVSDAASQVLNNSAGSSTQASPANNQNMSGTTSQRNVNNYGQTDEQARAAAPYANNTDTGYGGTMDSTQIQYSNLQYNDTTGEVSVGYVNIPQGMTNVNIPSYLKIPAGTLLTGTTSSGAFANDGTPGYGGSIQTNKDITVKIYRIDQDGSQTWNYNGTLNITFPSTLAVISPTFARSNYIPQGSTLNISKNTMFDNIDGPGLVSNAWNYAYSQGVNVNFY